MLTAHLIPLISLFLTPTLALSPFKVQNGKTNQEIFNSPHEVTTTSAPARVPVLLGVMSKCPDALFCEAFFDKVLKKVGHDKVDLSLSFIGKIDPSEPRYGVTCMHGVSECQGNIHELCAINRYSQALLSTHSDAQSTWWSFVQCLNEVPVSIGEEERARECAEQVGVDWDVPGGVGECVSGVEGKVLLEKSVFASQTQGIRNSCSMFVSGKLRCIHDSDWKECTVGHEVTDFVELIESEYRKINGLDDNDDWVLV